MFKSILMKKVKENKKQAGKVSAREKPVNGIRPSEKAKKKPSSPMGYHGADDERNLNPEE
jgi:hypothetical protein